MSIDEVKNIKVEIPKGKTNEQQVQEDPTCKKIQNETADDVKTVVEEREPTRRFKLASGEICYDRTDGHMDAHPAAHETLAEAISKIDSEGRDFIKDEVEMGREMAVSDCVETNEDDEIIYARRSMDRKGLTRFVKDREGVPTTKQTVLMRKLKKKDRYALITSWHGGLAPMEPFDKKGFKRVRGAEARNKAKQEAYEFWQTHALVWGSCDVIEGTETDECPWDIPEKFKK